MKTFNVEEIVVHMGLFERETGSAARFWSAVRQSPMTAGSR
jgi:hypothetical protein